LSWFTQVMLRALLLARLSAGSSRAASTTIMPQTTSNSIKLKPMLLLRCGRNVRLLEQL